MPAPKGMVRINIDVNEQTHERIKQLALLEDWSKRKVVLNAVKFYLRARGYKGEQ